MAGITIIGEAAHWVTAMLLAEDSKEQQLS